MRQKAALLAAMVLLVLLPGRQGIPLGEHQLLGEDWFLDQPYEGNPVEVLKKLMLNGGQGKRGDLPWPTVDQYLSAAGWSVGDDLIRLPIVFIPPFSGTRLLQRLEDRPIKTPLDVLCERDTAGEWQSMWLPSPGTKSPFAIRCVVENMAFAGKDGIPAQGSARSKLANVQGADDVALKGRSESLPARLARLQDMAKGLRERAVFPVVGAAQQRGGGAGSSRDRGGGNDDAPAERGGGAEAGGGGGGGGGASFGDAYPAKKGIETSFDEDFDGAMYLDEEHKVPIFGLWAEALERVGWQRGVDMHVLNYDWRKGPDEYMLPGGSFSRLKQMVEATVERTGKKVVVASMSMGGPMFALFCSRYVDEAWKAAHVDSFFSLSGSYGGSSSPLFSLLTGSWAKLIPWWLRPSVIALARSMGSPVWQSPSADVYGPGRVVVRTPSRNYTVEQIGDALDDAGATRASSFWEQFRDMNGPSRVAPNVTTYCIFGVSLPTPDNIVMSGELDNPSATGRFTWGDGDGTVLTPGLEACHGFGQHQDMPVRQFRFPGAPHSELLKSLDAFTLVAHRLAHPAKHADARGKHHKLFDMLGRH